MSKDKAVQITFFLLRFAAGLMFMQAGGHKIFDWFGGVPAEMGGHPATWSQTWIGGVLEFYGGLLVLLGLLTRPVAFILSGEMAVAYFQFHYKSEAFWPTQNGGVPAALYAFIFLFFAAYGGGSLSLDEAFWGKRKAEAADGGVRG